MATRKDRRSRRFNLGRERANLTLCGAQSMPPQQLQRKFRLVAPDLDIVLMTPGLRQIIGCLQPQPVVRVRPSGLLQPDRHFGRYPGLAVDDVGQRMACDAQDFRPVGHAQAQRIKAGVLYGVARMRRVFHGDASVPFLIVSQNVRRPAHLVRTVRAGRNLTKPDALPRSGAISKWADLRSQDSHNFSSPFPSTTSRSSPASHRACAAMLES